MPGALPAFVAASLVLAVTPGPGVIYIVTRTLAQGRAAGLGSVAGVACGNFLNAAGAALGLAALFALSNAAFLIVKYAGAAYLIWLGIRMWRGPSDGDAAAAPVVPVPVTRLFRDGLLVALLNPKTALFFAAFLPQFMNNREPAFGQAMLLGSVFVAIAASTDACYALLAAALAPRLARAGGTARFGRRAGGAALVVLGLLGAVSGNRRPA